MTLLYLMRRYFFQHVLNKNDFMLVTLTILQGVRFTYTYAIGIDHTFSAEYYAYLWAQK